MATIFDAITFYATIKINVTGFEGFDLIYIIFIDVRSTVVYRDQNANNINKFKTFINAYAINILHPYKMEHPNT